MAKLTNRALARILDASEARVSDARAGKTTRGIAGAIKAMEWLWPRLTEQQRTALQDGAHLKGAQHADGH